MILISGPAGAGKTAFANEWARTRPYPCAHISLDDVRLMVKSGYADPQDGWGPEQREQFEIARGSIAQMARRYVEAGIACVIDDAIFPSWPGEQPGADYEGWRREFGELPHRLIILMPKLDVVRDRNRARGEHHTLHPEMLNAIYRQMKPWRDHPGLPVIDNSRLSIGQTVAAVESVLAETAQL